MSQFISIFHRKRLLLLVDQEKDSDGWVAPNALALPAALAGVGPPAVVRAIVAELLADGLIERCPTRQAVRVADDGRALLWPASRRTSV